MKIKSLKIPAVIIVIGLVLSLAACLVSNIILTPTVTEHDFNYKLTYKLCGETKVLEGVYKCRFQGYNEGSNPSDRYYTGEYIVDGQSTFSHLYTIAQKDGAELFVAISFNECYLMGDTKAVEYEPILEEPYFGTVDKEGYPYEEEELPSEFRAEIVSWEYPEPIKNTFVFSGFSTLHAGSMLAMLVVGLLTIVACLVFVKKDKVVPCEALAKLSVLVNFAVCFLAIPFITVCTAVMELTVSTDDIWYQIFLCTPALSAFTVAASIALRRNGFTKAGFFIQFVGPVLFFAPLIVETIIYNFFG